jgi:hypothetical protein
MPNWNKILAIFDPFTFSRSQGQGGPPTTSAACQQTPPISEGIGRTHLLRERRPEQQRRRRSISKDRYERQPSNFTQLDPYDGGARGFRVAGCEQLIVIVAAGLSVGHWRDRHQAVHGYSGQRFHGCPSFWGPVWIAAVSDAAIQLPALVGLAILMLVERLRVEGGGRSRNAGKNRQSKQSRNYGLHGNPSS